jgi:hypothetical protein
VDLLRHRDGNRQVLVRAQVAGIPDAAQTLRLRLTGADVGLEAGQVHLTDGGNGADGQGTVDCYASDASGNAVAEGTYATCVRVTTATTGRFYVDLRLAHRHGTPSDVRFTVLPVGVPEDGDTANNSRLLTIG